MSFCVSLPTSRPFVRCRPVRLDAAFDGIGLPEVLIKIGAFLAVAGLLTGVMLYKSGDLTLFWVKLLPIPTAAGGGLVCLGVLILCLRELRAASGVANLQTFEQNPV